MDSGHDVQLLACNMERTPMQKNRASPALYAGLIVAVLRAMKRASIATFSTLLRPQASGRGRIPPWTAALLHSSKQPKSSAMAHIGARLRLADAHNVDTARGRSFSP